jgi:hypothetical protein
MSSEQNKQRSSEVVDLKFIIIIYEVSINDCVLPNISTKEKHWCPGSSRTPLC